MEERNDLLFLATVNFSGLVESIISFKYIVYALREIFVEIQTEFTGRLSLVQTWQFIFTVSMLMQSELLSVVLTIFH